MSKLDLYRLDEPPLPPITLRRSDADRVYEVAVGALLHNPRTAAGLLDELRRAAVVADDRAGPEVAGIGSYVEYVDQHVSPERVQRAQLVLPEDARAGDTLSVLSEFGAALLGLSPGQSIVWPDRRGGTERLTVVAVQPPRRAARSGAPVR
jgi:regulator of nucleoside diphosphate kinase